MSKLCKTCGETIRLDADDPLLEVTTFCSQECAEAIGCYCDSRESMACTSPDQHHASCPEVRAKV